MAVVHPRRAGKQIAETFCDLSLVTTTKHSPATQRQGLNLFSTGGEFGGALLTPRLERVSPLPCARKIHTTPATMTSSWKAGLGEPSQQDGGNDSPVAAKTSQVKAQSVA